MAGIGAFQGLIDIGRPPDCYRVAGQCAGPFSRAGQPRKGFDWRDSHWHTTNGFFVESFHQCASPRKKKIQLRPL